MGFEKVNLELTERTTSKLVDGADIAVERVAGAVVENGVNSVAYHEACHALAAMLLNIAVSGATDIPGPGYLGATWVADYHPTVAAAAEAMGCDGTGHDMWTVWAMGDDPSTAVSNARALLWGREDELRAVATSIQNAGMASGTEMYEAQSRVEEDVVKVTIEKNGETRTEYKTIRRGELYLDIPKEYPDVKQ